MEHNEHSEAYCALLYPPVFHPQVEHHEWRRSVVRWVETISQVAETTNDSVYQTFKATLARQLYYHALPSAQKSLIDRHQAIGDIDYKQHDQVTAVRQIMDIVAVDIPADALHRHIASFEAVKGCQRRPNEDLLPFLFRFRSLAADYKLTAGLSSSQQGSDILAIILLKNARLSDKALASAKQELISRARTRENKNMPISQPILRTLKQVQSNLNALFSSLAGRSTTQEHEQNTSDNSPPVLKELQSSIELLDTSLSSVHTPNSKPSSIEDKILGTKPRYRLNYDDTVTVIQKLSFSLGNQALAMTKDDVEDLIDQAMRTFKEKDLSKSNRRPKKGIGKPGFRPRK